MQKLEQDSGCLSLSLPTLSFETGSVTESRVHYLSEAGCPTSPQDLPACHHLTGIGVCQCALPHLVFMWVLGIKTQALTLPTDLSLLSPRYKIPSDPT